MDQPSDPKPEAQDPKGHTMGLFDTAAACEAAIRALHTAGFSSDQTTVFEGKDGLQRFSEMLEASSWGESAEKFLKQGTAELQLGHSVLSVQVGDESQAAKVAAIATQHGGHSFYHFGLVVDTRLTP